ncbi:MAG: hypothetical protein M0Z46_10660 [Actinomycetota bacterium]|jgi:Holliday junction resolvase|nr:hypothetical protein [Actinomycetota bacterium]
MSRSRQIGTAWETRLVRYLVEHGFPYAERRALAGSADRGDVTGIPGVVIEAKCARRVELAAWVDEMVAEKRNAGAQIGAVIFPRRNHATARAYVLMELSDFVELIS